MTIKKRKKVVKYRGSHTHGGGAKKKRRGAGNRGGRGMAGSGKRADQKKQSILKLYGKEYFGKKGFKIPQKKKKILKAINLSYLEEILKDLLDKRLIKREGEKYHIKLKEVGYDKLLGTGKATKELHVIAKHFSKKAKEKIESKKGSVKKE